MQSKRKMALWHGFNRVFTILKKRLAFSLIELMISLIVISTVTAAFTPVITKKLKSSGVTVGGLTSGNPFENVKLGKEECAAGLNAAGITIVNNNCTMCKLTPGAEACLACSDMNCTANQFENTPDCTCKSCNTTYDSKCFKCDIKGCKVCVAGYYLDGSGASASCKSVDTYPGCADGNCYTDPEGVPPVTKPTACPDGAICNNGIKTDCDTPELTHKLCSGGTATDCPIGKKCDGGVPSECAPHKMCSGGVETDCPAGKKCDDGVPSDCAPNKKCSGGQEYPCGQYKKCSGGIETDCTNGKKCSGGIESNCSANKLCSGGVEQTCPDGSICTNGIATPCTTPELTHKWCTGGTANTCTAGYTCDGGIRGNKCSTAGYYCTEGTSKTCSSKTPGCISCNVETGTCTTCDSGYYKTGSNTCAGCSVITGCSTCTSSTSCSKCTGSYYLNGTTCSSCPSNASCSGTSSWSCTSTYFKSGSSCLKCSNYITGCNTCTSSSVCSTCQSGYVKSGNTCTPSVTCSSTQYKSNNTCYDCPTGCSSCTSSTSCSGCKPGYYKSGSTCASCPTGCSACSSATSCSSCKDGYTLSGSTCVLAVCNNALNISGCYSEVNVYTVGDLTCNPFKVCRSCCAGWKQSSGQCYTNFGSWGDCTRQLSELKTITTCEAVCTK